MTQTLTRASIGEYNTGPITLFYGIGLKNQISDRSPTDVAKNVALNIIRERSLLPGGCHRDTDFDQMVFQHLTANLDNIEITPPPTSLLQEVRNTALQWGSYFGFTETQTNSSYITRPGIIDGHAYAQATVTKDPSFAQKISGRQQLPSSFDFDISDSATSDVRTRTICCDESWNGRGISFFFDLSAEQVATMGAKNGGGKSLFGRFIVHCTNELPLELATSIILGSDIINPNRVREELEAALNENGFSQITIEDNYVPKMGIHKMPRPLGFDIPIGATVTLSSEQVIALQIHANGQSKWQDFKGSIFICQRIGADNFTADNFTVTRLLAPGTRLLDIDK